MEKTYLLGVGSYMCPICADPVDREILVNHHEQNSLHKEIFLGFKVCEDDQNLYDEGYIALIAIDTNNMEEPFDLLNVPRTGNGAHLSKDMFEKIFPTIEPPNNEYNIFFCSDSTIEYLEKILVQIEKEKNE